MILRIGAAVAQIWSYFGDLNLVRIFGHGVSTRA